ncbi:hypothetical protein PHYSODRAFT_523533 [Phytophthora sojae]|uniref:Uncharacterized protein n=1 Tax=Phytophthora sojae (strain P6497) TaxID=1094619 RepID=G5A2L8_PHYSP|nr:hypothetical protein PHYSODRAFT_523533 [Phytophthora sojae]EGZ09908.1 hypothetical protein PHYSODRAFT_523533 [Phytophthora sojae]|eukprot:XP_009534769.1 hypothetical protein PHYSODRAFT_523533 [Phytophthora sojae]
MVNRYFRILEHLATTDDALVGIPPAPASNKQLRGLLKGLKKIESVIKVLQGKGESLLDVHVWFDGLIPIMRQYVTYLGPRADIVHRPDFESGCVRVLEGKTSRPTRGEKAALHPFRCEDASDRPNGQDAESGDKGSFVDRLQKRHRLAAVEPRYELLGEPFLRLT